MSYRTEPMNIATNYNYKNAEIELVIEDDAITTAKIYMDGECEEVMEITSTDGGDLKFTRKHTNAVLKECFKKIDELLAEDGREECTDMTLVRR